MFSTLRARLILSYVAIAALCLLMALGILVGLGKSYNERMTFNSLRSKSLLVLPFVRPLLANQQQRPAQKLVLDTIREGIANSGLRVLFVDPATLDVVEDTSVTYYATGKRLDDLEGKQTDLYLPRRQVQGKFRLSAENQTFQYVARAVQMPPAARVGGGAGPLGNSVIVVFAQAEPKPLQLASDLVDYMLPAAIVALMLSLLVGYALARSISKPIDRLAEGASAMARGDYSQRLPVEGHDEFAALTDRFNKMAEEVGRSHQMERDFVANVSHDLKTPLTSIQGFSQAMLDGAIIDARGYKEAAAIINGEAQRMDRLVSELLVLTRLQNGLNTLDLHPTDLGTLLAQLVLAMQPQAANAGVTLKLEQTGGNVMVLADGDRLKQAFGNLLDNALKYTQSGGRVFVEMNASTPQTGVAVRDTGRGIPSEDLHRVMERFYQVDKSRSAPDGKSVGLGLAIAREIVRAHHGEITIDSRQGEGTCVSVLLPSAPLETPSPAKRSKLKLLNSAARHASSPHETDIRA